MKHHDPVVAIQAYELLAFESATARCTWRQPRPVPFSGHHQIVHVSERLLSRGIGDTIRPPSAPPVEEVQFGLQILSRST